MIIADRRVNGKAITNPECLKDCFSDTSGTTRRQRRKMRQQRRKGKRQMSEDDSICFALLIDDVTSKGTCKTGDNPAEALSTPELNIWGFNELVGDCEMTDRPVPDYG